MGRWRILLGFLLCLSVEPLAAEIDRDAKYLNRVCNVESKSTIECLSYIQGVVDAYRANNPSCQISAGLPLLLMLDMPRFSGNLIVQGDGNFPAGEAVYTAAGLMAGCNAPQQAQPMDKKACAAGFEALDDDWISSYQKQALLELLRNKGCLG